MVESRQAYRDSAGNEKLALSRSLGEQVRAGMLGSHVATPGRPLLLSLGETGDLHQQIFFLMRS